MNETETFASGWDAIAAPPNKRPACAHDQNFMRQIAEIIKANNWKHSEAALHCGVTQPRMNDLFRGRVSRF